MKQKKTMTKIIHLRTISVSVIELSLLKFESEMPPTDEYFENLFYFI